jgi:hypothetical protein
MKKRLTFVLMLGVCLAGGSQKAQAQVEVGPRVGFDIVGDVEELFLGADARIHLPAMPLQINGAFDFYFTDEKYDEFVQFSINALYEFGVANAAFTPYAGGGLGISSSEPKGSNKQQTDVGLNVIGGAVFSAGTLRPFAQAQITFGDPDLFTIGGGLLFSIGR